MYISIHIYLNIALSSQYIHMKFLKYFVIVGIDFMYSMYMNILMNRGHIHIISYCFPTLTFRVKIPIKIHV